MTSNEQTYRGACLNCGDEWEEDERPTICPECHSTDVMNGKRAAEILNTNQAFYDIIEGNR